MFTNFVNVSLYVHIANSYVVHLKLMLYINYINKTGKRNIKI